MTDAHPPQRGGFELQPFNSQGVRPEFGNASGEGVDLDNIYGSPNDFAVFTAKSDEHIYTDVKSGRRIAMTDAPQLQRDGFELQPFNSRGLRLEFGSASGEGVDLDNIYGSPDDFAVFTAKSDDRTYTDVK